MWRHDETGRTRSSPTRSNSIWATSSRRWPGRSAPKDRVALQDGSRRLRGRDGDRLQEGGRDAQALPVEGETFDLGHGDVVIAAITSCTNTSNPSVLIGAGLLARNANRRGPEGRSPGSRRRWRRARRSSPSTSLGRACRRSSTQLGFNLVGFGCTTCIGNSGPLPAPISKTINDKGLIAAAVLSGNRNFEGRVSPDVQANYLASPPLVVAYALAGSVHHRPHQGAARRGSRGQAVYLKDIWPTSARRSRSSSRRTSPARCSRALRRRLQGRRALAGGQGTDRPDLCLGRYVDLCAEPALFPRHAEDFRPRRATSRARASSACSATRSPPTTSRRPVRSRRPRPPAHYLTEHGVAVADFNQYGTRRGNHEVMMRGTFANIRIRNHMLGPEWPRGRLRHPLSQQGRAADLRRLDEVTRRIRCRW